MKSFLLLSDFSIRKDLSSIIKSIRNFSLPKPFSKRRLIGCKNKEREIFGTMCNHEITTVTISHEPYLSITSLLASTALSILLNIYPGQETVNLYQKHNVEL